MNGWQSVSGQFLINPPKWLQRWYCRKNFQHWPWIGGKDAGKCRWCGRGGLMLDSQGNHYACSHLPPPQEDE